MHYTKVFEVIDDVYTVLVTASESKAYAKTKSCEHPWVIEKHLNSQPHKEIVYENVEEFKEKYSL